MISYKCLHMFPIRNTKVKEFCKNVLDIDYIVGWDISKRNLNSEQNYVDLALLYSFNDSRINLGQKPYIQILTDDSGSRYAQLSEDGAQYALSNDLSFMSECKERDKRNVPLRKAISKLVDDSLEDRICEKCGNVLGIDCTKTEFWNIIKNMIYHNKRESKTHVIKNDPWADVFLTFKDISGTYMN